MQETAIKHHRVLLPLVFQLAADSGQSVTLRLEQLTKLLHALEDKVKVNSSLY